MNRNNRKLYFIRRKNKLNLSRYRLEIFNKENKKWIRKENEMFIENIV